MLFVNQGTFPNKTHPNDFSAEHDLIQLKSDVQEGLTPEQRDFDQLLSDDEETPQDNQASGKATIREINQKIGGAFDIQRYLMKIPPNFEKAEIHGVRNKFFQRLILYVESKSNS